MANEGVEVKFMPHAISSPKYFPKIEIYSILRWACWALQHQAKIQNVLKRYFTILGKRNGMSNKEILQSEILNYMLTISLFWLLEKKNEGYVAIMVGIFHSSDNKSSEKY